MRNCLTLYGIIHKYIYLYTHLTRPTGQRRRSIFSSWKVHTIMWGKRLSSSPHLPFLPQSFFFGFKYNTTFFFFTLVFDEFVYIIIIIPNFILLSHFFRNCNLQKYKIHSSESFSNYIMINLLIKFITKMISY